MVERALLEPVLSSTLEKGTRARPDSDHHVIYSVARDVTATKHADAERDRLVAELTTALAEVKTLREILPICSYCRKIRDDDNY